VFDGWHGASDDEWKTLETYLGMEVFDSNLEGYRGNDQGTQLKTDEDIWHIQNDMIPGSNESGFNALPGGFRKNNNITNTSQEAYFWTSSYVQSTYISIIYRSLVFNNAKINRDTCYKHDHYGLSIRCIKNDESYVMPVGDDCYDAHYCSSCTGCSSSCCPNYCSGNYYYYNRSCSGEFCVGATSDYCPNGCNENGCID
jgi:uncharacterized protein (TIGR02145 family)